MSTYTDWLSSLQSWVPPTDFDAVLTGMYGTNVTPTERAQAWMARLLADTGGSRSLSANYQNYLQNRAVPGFMGAQLSAYGGGTNWPGTVSEGEITRSVAGGGAGFPPVGGGAAQAPGTYRGAIDALMTTLRKVAAGGATGQQNATYDYWMTDPSWLMTALAGNAGTGMYGQFMNQKIRELYQNQLLQNNPDPLGWLNAVERLLSPYSSSGMRPPLPG